jgi:hypothetical protein
MRSPAAAPTPAARYHDLGPAYYETRTDKDRKIRNHVRRL